MPTTYVTCPRCHHELNARLHGITATDAQACPRCLAKDGLTVPMFLLGKERAGQPSSDRGGSPSDA